VNENFLRVWLRAWALVTVVDGVFATLLPVLAYGQPLGRAWQNVAAVLLGRTAIYGGARTIVFGLVMHATVALVWTTVFLVLALFSGWMRRIVATPGGIIGVATLYGPLIWIVMSMVVIPAFTHRATQISQRWWVQLLAHIPFVALPIVATIGRGLRAPVAVVDARPVGDVA
jgi:cellulose synthase/poly-beta-1,6-N-acetylglucosamine synthase-like glycosyltransferase